MWPSVRQRALEYITLKVQYSSKGTIKMKKKKATYSDKIFANHIIYKGLILKHKTLTTQNKTNQFLKWGIYLNRHPSKGIWMVNKHEKMFTIMSHLRNSS